MRKQEFLAKWQSGLGEQVPLIFEELKQDINSLLSDGETISNIICKLDEIARDYNSACYGLPVIERQNMRETVKNILNNELD